MNMEYRPNNAWKTLEWHVWLFVCLNVLNQIFVWKSVWNSFKKLYVFQKVCVSKSWDLCLKGIPVQHSGECTPGRTSQTVTEIRSCVSSVCELLKLESWKRTRKTPKNIQKYSFSLNLIFGWSFLGAGGFRVLDFNLTLSVNCTNIEHISKFPCPNQDHPDPSSAFNVFTSLPVRCQNLYRLIQT